jgi:hypothetical protein
MRNLREATGITLCKARHMYDELPYVQIECINGNPNSWSWDNLPVKLARVVGALSSTAIMAGTGPVSPPPRLGYEFMVRQEPDLPRWLDHNENMYHDKVGRILTKLNPLRDRYDALARQMGWGFPATHDFDLESIMMRWSGERSLRDSPEVREFQDIVKGFLRIEGFVHPSYTKPRAQDVYECVGGYASMASYNKPRRHRIPPSGV